VSRGLSRDGSTRRSATCPLRPRLPPLQIMLGVRRPPGLRAAQGSAHVSVRLPKLSKWVENILDQLLRNALECRERHAHAA
jgi:hypothetical protein